MGGALELLGVEHGGLIDTVQDAVETVHGQAAVESVGRRVADAAERMRPSAS